MTEVVSATAAAYDLCYVRCACSVLVTITLACTDESLYSINTVPSQPDRIAFSGQICTDNPATRSFPLRVLFLVDSSPKMSELDPAGQRVAVLLEAVNRVLSPAEPNRAVAIGRFASDPFVLTDGFSTDGAVVTGAVGLTGQIDPCVAGCRDFDAALSTASSIITADLLTASAGIRSRTRYVVVMLASGPRDVGADSPACTSLCDGTKDPSACLLDCEVDEARESVANLRDFARENGAADLVLHSVHLRDIGGDPATLAFADDLLDGLAEEGGGQYLPFDMSDLLTYTPIDFESLQSPFQMASLIASNVNVRVGATGALSDSDADGLSDDEEETTGTRADLRDTDADGLGDRLEVLLAPTGLDALVANVPAQCLEVDPLADDDGDTLTDCEEILLGTDPTLPDSDADGDPDPVEFSAGTNYLAADGLGDLDSDGVSNGEELRLHSDPRANDPASRDSLGYRYSIISAGVAAYPFFGDLTLLTGVTPIEASVATNGGVGKLFYDAAAHTLAWQDPADLTPGPPVPILGDDRLILQALSSMPMLELGERSLTVDVDEAALPTESVDEELTLGFVEQECVDYRVSNVLLRGTQATDTTVAGTNRIFLFFGEVPTDNPLGIPIVRAALVQVVFQPPDQRLPDVDEVVLQDGDFVLLGQED